MAIKTIPDWLKHKRQEDGQLPRATAYFGELSVDTKPSMSPIFSGGSTRGIILPLGYLSCGIGAHCLTGILEA